jgi:hypothetical protein
MTPNHRNQERLDASDHGATNSLQAWIRVAEYPYKAYAVQGILASHPRIGRNVLWRRVDARRSLRDVSSNPILALFLEHHVEALFQVLGANPRYRKNAVRAGLGEKAKFGAGFSW